MWETFVMTKISPSQHSIINDARITTFGRLIEVVARLDSTFGSKLDEPEAFPKTWFEIMLRLARSENQQLKMSELAEQVALTTGGITRLIDRMTTAGLAERLADPSDRRVQYAHITQLGVDQLLKVCPIHAADLQREVYDRLSASEVKVLDAILDKLR
jgi:MarR family transcriptional regulator, 2-MHQ and catechol-resistance regulon repressor